MIFFFWPFFSTVPTQLYRELLGQHTGVDETFDVSSGILLQDSMHKRFDRFEFSIYCKVRVREKAERATGSQDVDPAADLHLSSILCPHHQDDAYYIHMFTFSPGKETQERQYHGKRLDHSWFRLKNTGPSALPDKRMLAWHYRQAAQTRLRGYAYGMSADRRGGAVARPDDAPEPRADD